MSNGTDVGIANCALLCPNEHDLGRLIKHAAHRPIQLRSPVAAQQQWPREGDEERTVVYCRECGQSCGEATDLLRTVMDKLVADESEYEAVHILGYE